MNRVTDHCILDEIIRYFLKRSGVNRITRERTGERSAETLYMFIYTERGAPNGEKFLRKTVVRYIQIRYKGV